MNFRKTRVMRQGVRQQLVGLVANQRMNVMRSDFDRLKATLTNCVRQGPASQNRESHPHFRLHLEGRVAFVESINRQKGQPASVRSSNRLDGNEHSQGLVQASLSSGWTFSR